jgi:hypothetical protein
MKYYMLSGGMDVSEAITTVINEVETNGSKYWFIAENEDLIFVKDYNTSELFKYISLSAFLKENREDNMSITISSFMAGDTQYTLGLCVKEAYIKEMGRISSHFIYIIIPVFLVSAMIIVILVVAILHISKSDEKIKVLEKEAIERNITIEKLTIGMKKLRMGNRVSDNNIEDVNIKNVIYNKEVLNSILDKLSKRNIVPLTIIVIEFINPDKSQNRYDYYEDMKMISTLITKEHVIAEIQAGIFTILLFKTFSKDIDEIKDILVNQWALPLKKKGLNIRIGFSCIENYDADVEKAFDIICREVMKGTDND